MATVHTVRTQDMSGVHLRHSTDESPQSWVAVDALCGHRLSWGRDVPDDDESPVTCDECEEQR